MAYVMKILVLDEAEPLIVHLAGLDHPEAEQFTAEVRANVEEARSVNAPVIVVALPGDPRPELTLEPGAVRSIDLEEAE